MDVLGAVGLLKSAMEGVICPACYANRKTAILQPRGILLTCTVCKADVPNLPPPNVVTTVRGHF